MTAPPPRILLCFLTLLTARAATVAQWTWSVPQCFSTASAPATSCWSTGQAGYQNCFTATNGATSSILYPGTCAATQCKCWWTTTAPGNFAVQQGITSNVFPLDGVKMCVSTVDYTSLTLSSSSLWRNSSGPATATFAYSVNAGSSWTTISTSAVPLATAPLSLALPAGAENSPNFCVGFGGAVAYSGYLKWGDMTLSGTASSPSPTGTPTPTVSATPTASGTASGTGSATPSPPPPLTCSVLTVAGNLASVNDGAVHAADGIGACAALSGPRGLALSPSGTTVAFSDQFNHLIRSLDLRTWAVSTIAGNTSVGAADGAPLGGATFNLPTSLIFNASGALLISDFANHRIRVLVQQQQQQQGGGGTLA